MTKHSGRAPVSSTDVPPVTVLVIGSGLRDVCGDQAALGLRFIEDAATAPKYRLLVVDEAFAALVEDTNGGASVTGEIVEVSAGRWAEIVAGEPECIAFESVELSDGRSILAAVGDRDRILETATDITEFGSFAAYRATLERPPPA